MAEKGLIIVLGVTGSIAAYKAADLCSQLTKLGHSVRVVMTAHALEFIPALPLQVLSRNPVTCGLFDEIKSWHPEHIQLADEADLLLVAPATANIIAQLSYGLASDALTSIALATRAPLLIAPAMNGKMWTHPATVENVERLKKRGVEFIGPQKNGLLACGYEGEGKMSPVEEIVARIQEIAVKLGKRA